MAAGVVGLAVARALAQAGREAIVVEAQTAIGQGVSSRNSEVIHAGLYYTPARSRRGCACAARSCCTHCAHRTAWTTGAAAS